MLEEVLEGVGTRNISLGARVVHKMQPSTLRMRPTRQLKQYYLWLLGMLLFTCAWLLSSSPTYNFFAPHHAGAPLGNGAPPPWTGEGQHAPHLMRQSEEEMTKLEQDPPDKIEIEKDGKPGRNQPLAQQMAAIYNKRGVPDSRESDPWKKREQDAWKLIILYQHNFDVLMQAVDSYRRASDIMAKNIIVVDNSNEKDAFASKVLKKKISEVIKTPRLLNFPELHNFMADTGFNKGLDFYFWAHADNYVLPWAPGRDLGKDVVDCMRLQIRGSPNWGMMLFSYDHLAAFRTQTMVQVPWDPNVFQYGSECDVYGRIRDAGYDAKACKVHLSYDMKRVLNISDKMTWNETKAILEDDKNHKLGRNQWRENAMSEDEQAWRTAMKMASRQYLKEKWVQRGCKVRGLPCHKAWPYCPKCPQHISDCFAKRPSRQQLGYIHSESRKVFRTDPNQPISFEKFLLRRSNDKKVAARK